jgi:hypothetical protein
MLAEAICTVEDRVPAPERTLGWAVLEWTAAWLLQPDGASAGDAWEFTREQTRIVLRWYEVDDAGRFVARRGVLRRMKGWGKDPFLAAIAAVELCGPCRFGGWDTDGMPIAIPHPAPWIQVAAVSQDQTRNTMTLFPGLFSRAAIDEYKIDLGKTIIYARGGGRIEAVTSSPRALEGGRASLAILNESQEWIEANDGVAMARTIRRNLAKSNDGSARSFEICNAHRPGEESVAEETFEAWRAADGELAGLYYDSLEAPRVMDLRDADALRSALTVTRGDSHWIDIGRLAAEIQDPTTPEHISRRYYLNEVVAVAAERWLPAGAWSACARPGQEIPEGARVVLGFDGSSSGDSTALIASTVSVTPHVVLVGLWEKDEHDGPEWRVPRIEVMEMIRDACGHWQVEEVAADPFLWQSDLEALADEGVPVVEFRQSGEHMLAATQRTFELVTTQALTHDGDPDLARHIANAVPKTDSRGTRLTKDKKRSPKRIDLAIATVMAVHRACTLAAEPKKPKFRIY